MPARPSPSPARRCPTAPIASRPGWRLLTLRCEAFDSTGDKVLEFESAVLVETG